MIGNEGRDLWRVERVGEKLGSGVGLTSSRPCKKERREGKLLIGNENFSACSMYDSPSNPQQRNV